MTNHVEVGIFGKELRDSEQSEQANRGDVNPQPWAALLYVGHREP